MDNKSKIYLAIPFLLLLAIYIGADHINFEKGISDIEEEILRFTPSDLKVKERELTPVRIVTASPMNFKVAHINQPGRGQQKNKSKKGIKKGELVKQLDYNDRNLSLIVISGQKKMAIIKGFLVKEGDALEGITIAKIEPDRVLIKNKISKWLYLTN